MPRIKTAIIMTLAGCLLAASVLNLATHSSTTLSLECSLFNPADPQHASVVINLKLGSSDSKTRAATELALTRLTQSVDSLRKEALELLHKKMHIA
jgi:hypothetical protein